MSLSAASRTYLETGWSFKKTEDSDEALKPVKKVPTVSHMDLLDNGLFVYPTIPSINFLVSIANMGLKNAVSQIPSLT